MGPFERQVEAALHSDTLLSEWLQQGVVTKRDLSEGLMSDAIRWLGRSAAVLKQVLNHGAAKVLAFFQKVFRNPSSVRVLSQRIYGRLTDIDRKFAENLQAVWKHKANLPVRASLKVIDAIATFAVEAVPSFAKYWAEDRHSFLGGLTLLLVAAGAGLVTMGSITGGLLSSAGSYWVAALFYEAVRRLGQTAWLSQLVRKV